MRDFGGMISFLAETEEKAVELVARTKLFQLAESLGGVESLIEHPARMTHASTADAPFAAPRNLVRLSVGIESVDDLIADLAAALVPAAAPRQVTVCYLATAGSRSTCSTLGAARTVGAYLLDTAEGWPSSTAGPRRACPALRRGSRSAGSSSATSGTCCSRTSTSTTRARPACSCASSPELQVYVSEVGAPHLVDPSRLERSARRLYGDAFDGLWGELAPVPEENVHVAGDRAAGLECFPAPGHASHHVCYFDGDDALRRRRGGRPDPAAPRRSCRRRRRRTSTSRPGTARSSEIERRAPERLALIHFGVAEDVGRHLAELRERLDTWTRARRGRARPRRSSSPPRKRRPAAGGGRGVRPRDAVLAVLRGPEALLGQRRDGVSARAAARARVPPSLPRPHRSPSSAARSRRSRSRSPCST